MKAPDPLGPAERPSRRQMLKAAALAAVGLGAPLASPAEDSSNPGPPSKPLDQIDSPPWWLGREFPRSTVIEVRSDRVVTGAVADPGLVRRMLRQGLMRLTGLATPALAIDALLGERRRIAIKFNSVAAAAIGTTDVVARALIDVLDEAGISRDRVTLIEVPAALARELGTNPPVRGWGAGIPVGDTVEPLAAWVDDADAIINVPFLKTHQFAGMSGALKNLSHAVIRRPARYHANGCAPYVGQVIGNPRISERLRLTVMNALRVVVRNGPDANSDDVISYGSMLLGRDPLALDGSGRMILDRERARIGAAVGLSVPYLLDAAERNVGRPSSPLAEHVTEELAE